MRKQLTLSQFNAAIALFPKMKKTNVSMARQVLVKGNAPAEVALSYGVTRQLVSKYALKVYDKYMVEVAKAPPGFENITLTLPKQLLNEARKLERAARRYPAKWKTVVVSVPEEEAKRIRQIESRAKSLL